MIKISKISVLISSIFLTTACQTTNPYTGEQEQSNATTGAIVGAVTGAIIGATTSSKKDRVKGAVIGAGVGGAAGAGIGYYMDVQEAKLKEKLKGAASA